MSIRVQRKRTKGWRMPENTVYVGRPTKWGNPYRSPPMPLETALHEYRLWLDSRVVDSKGKFLDPLRSANLACWCPLNRPCHADILLEYLRKSS